MAAIKEDMSSAPVIDLTADDEFEAANDTRVNPNLKDEIYDRLIQAVVTFKPDEEYQIYQYEKPKGNGEMDERAVHILQCAIATGPESATPDLPQSPAEKDETTWTIKLLYKWLPEAEEKHALHDFHSKRKVHFKKRNGKSIRVASRDLMKEDGLLDFHLSHIVEYVEAHAAGIVFVYGRETTDAFALSFEGLGKEYGIYEGITIGAKKRTVVLLPHPEYVQVYANQDIRRRVISILEQVSVDYDMDIDIAELEKIVREWAIAAATYDPDVAAVSKTLKRVKIPHTNPAELLEIRRQRKREADARYRRSAKGQATRERRKPKAMAYQKSEHGLAVRRKNSKARRQRVSAAVEAGESWALKERNRKNKRNAGSYIRTSHAEKARAAAGDESAIKKRNSKLQKAKEDSKAAKKKLKDGLEKGAKWASEKKANELSLRRKRWAKRADEINLLRRQAYAKKSGSSKK